MNKHSANVGRGGHREWLLKFMNIHSHQHAHKLHIYIIIESTHFHPESFFQKTAMK